MSHKITIIGDVGVGKTSILKRLIKDEFNKKELSTIGISFESFLVNERRLYFWDTAGEERFKSISRIYYNGTKLIIIVFDVHDWNKIYTWIDETKRVSDSPIILMGNKFLDDKTINYLDIKKICEKIAKEKSMDLYLVNAKSGLNIKESFKKISNRFPKSPKIVEPKFKQSMEGCCTIM